MKLALIEPIRYNYKIHKTLKNISKQRCEIILQPQNIWVVSNLPSHNDETDTLICTCQMRGWIEPLTDSIPRAELTEDFRLPSEGFTGYGVIWKLTDSGWSAIYRVHQLSILSLFLTLISVFIAATLY